MELQLCVAFQMTDMAAVCLYGAELEAVLTTRQPRGQQGRLIELEWHSSSSSSSSSSRCLT